MKIQRFVWTLYRSFMHFGRWGGESMHDVRIHTMLVNFSEHLEKDTPRVGEVVGDAIGLVPILYYLRNVC